MRISRRRFLNSTLVAGTALAVQPFDALALEQRTEPRPWRPLRPVRRTLAERFPDLRRHFIFEYYPWYRTDPYSHWDEGGHRPPVDLASNYMPQLGAYDSRSLAVMEQHARWIADSGVGAINVSWWGRENETPGLIHNLMDVMRAHDIHVTFHIEPYAVDRASRYASDIQYLISEYGDRRHWDCFLLVRHEDGAVGPIFKSFETILTQQAVDCHGTVVRVANYTSDQAWRQQTDQVRKVFAADFDRITLLADSLAANRVVAAGFDGIAIYDNYVRPDQWRPYAQAFSRVNRVFSFNCNPGFDAVVRRNVDPGSCYAPPKFEPGGRAYDWSQRDQREAARSASESRIVESFSTTIALQTDPASSNVRRGFFLTYVNSFNEWFEGHQFEPMKNAADLSAGERAIGYHDPDDGEYRMGAITRLVGHVLAGGDVAAVTGQN
jgi:hypothetical protein